MNADRKKYIINYNIIKILKYSINVGANSYYSTINTKFDKF